MLREVESLAELRTELEKRGRTIGFVPTMGALHRGHQALMERARQETDVVVVSIFVNPTQFGPGEDFDRYPRTREADLELCRQVNADLVWFPRVEELYPAGCQSWIEVQELGERFEGESRPGHFRGVATVVGKLFNAVKPSRAYFGEKDLQQLLLVRQMVRDLLFDLEVVGVPTAREASGLALSSRNSYLTSQERDQAALLYRSLLRVRDSHLSGVRQAKELKKVFLDSISGLECEIERLDLLHPRLERSYEGGEEVDAGYCSVALRFGKVRLIDNIALCS